MSSARASLSQSTQQERIACPHSASMAKQNDAARVAPSARALRGVSAPSGAAKPRRTARRARKTRSRRCRRVGSDAAGQSAAGPEGGGTRAENCYRHGCPHAPRHVETPRRAADEPGRRALRPPSACRTGAVWCAQEFQDEIPEQRSKKWNIPAL